MKSTHIQARLHPDQEHERRALDVYNERLEAGQTARQIIADALCALADEPIYIPDNRLTSRTLRAAFSGMRDMFAELFGTLLDERIDELARMTPGDRRQHINDVVRGSSFRDSIVNAVEVTDYEE